MRINPPGHAADEKGTLQMIHRGQHGPASGPLLTLSISREGNHMYFLPRKETELALWATSFGTKIVAGPTDYGLLASEAANFQALAQSFSDALALASDPATRTAATLAAKSDAMKLVRRAAGQLSKRIQGMASVTNEQKAYLGLTVPDAEPSSSDEAPATPPVVQVVSVEGNNVYIRLQDKLWPLSRRKPEGIIGAVICSHVGEETPGPDTVWKFEGTVGRMRNIEITFPGNVPPRSRVWITATWFDGQKRSSPPALPVSTYTQYSLAV